MNVFLFFLRSCRSCLSGAGMQIILSPWMHNESKYECCHHVDFPTRRFLCTVITTASTHHLHYHYHLRCHHCRHANHHYNQKYHNYDGCVGMAQSLLLWHALIKWQWFIGAWPWLCSLRFNNRWTLLTAHVWRLPKCQLGRSQQLWGHVSEACSPLFNNSTFPAVSFQAQSSAASKLTSEFSPDTELDTLQTQTGFVDFNPTVE